MEGGPLILTSTAVEKVCTLKQLLLLRIFTNSLPVNCGAPNLPVNSSMLSGPSSGTGKGSEVTFQCNEGLSPSNEITIVCTSEERWSPDPEGIVCGVQPGLL